jgi:hypothetical protein
MTQSESSQQTPSPSVHNPGPWEIIQVPMPETADHIAFAIADEKQASDNRNSITSDIICLVSPRDKATGQDMANMHLIAAAPRMLDALIIVREYMIGRPGKADDMWEVVDGAIKQALNRIDAGHWVQSELDQLRAWKQQALVLQMQWYPIMDWAQKQPDIKLGTSIADYVLNKLIGGADLLESLKAAVVLIDFLGGNMNQPQVVAMKEAIRKVTE